MPKRISAQLASLVSKAPEGNDWLHEIKLDGYRILARIDSGKVTLFSRSHHDWTERMAALVKPLQQLPLGTAVLDGEVVVLDEHGVSSFQALQNAFGPAPRPKVFLVYYAFDLIYLDGFDLTRVLLIDRKQALSKLLARCGNSSRLRLSEHLVGKGGQVHSSACRAGLEGIISKRADALYVPGRGDSWLKVKCRHEQELVIGGYTDPTGARLGFGALLVGYYDRGKLRYAGRVGTGFNARLLQDLLRRLKRGSQTASPFVDLPRGERGVHWVKPELVAQVSFSNWTNDGLVRQAAFLGLREDKSPRAVRRETPGQVVNSTATASALSGSRPYRLNSR